MLFFLQAVDGIRDYKVTGVQTCALPISRIRGESRRQLHDALRLPQSQLAGRARHPCRPRQQHHPPAAAGRPGPADALSRSEERRVGKECTTRMTLLHVEMMEITEWARLL